MKTRLNIQFLPFWRMGYSHCLYQNRSDEKPKGFILLVREHMTWTILHVQLISNSVSTRFVRQLQWNAFLSVPQAGFRGQASSMGSEQYNSSPLTVISSGKWNAYSVKVVLGGIPLWFWWEKATANARCLSILFLDQFCSIYKKATLKCQWHIP